MRGSERADRPASSENKMEVILSINDGQLFYEHSCLFIIWSINDDQLLYEHSCVSLIVQTG